MFLSRGKFEPSTIVAEAASLRRRMYKIQINQTNHAARETTLTFNNQAKEVCDVPSCDIVSDETKKVHDSIRPDSLDGSKPCDRDTSHKSTIKRRNKVYYVDPGGVVIFDPREAIDSADADRHNR